MTDPVAINRCGSEGFSGVLGHLRAGDRQTHPDSKFQPRILAQERPAKAYTYPLSRAPNDAAVTEYQAASANADPTELEKFGRLANRWWDPDGPLATLHQINPLRTEYIAARCALAGARVLDVGCGAGILSESLTDLGATVTAIDLAPENLAAARRHAAERGLEIDYRQSSVEAIAADEPGRYDVVTCLEVLEHLPAPDEAIAACAAAVRPGGAVFLSTINRNLKSFMFGILGAEYVLRMLPRGTHDYTKLIRPSELGRTLRASSLVLEDLTGLHFNPLTQRYWLGGNVDVNYFAMARRPAAD